MKLSVITVAYNNKNGLERTIKSVVNQTCKDFEYIIVDGASTDGSVDVIKKYESLGISRWVSEPDSGIYNAMNKAVRMATGDYCLFMNSGDEIYANDTIEKVLSIGFTENFVQGVILATYLGIRHPQKEVSLGFYYHGGNNYHQASFISRKMLLDNPYDESLRIASDLKFNIECLVFRNCSYRPIDVVIAKYEGGGRSFGYHKDEREKIFRDLVQPRILADYENEHYFHEYPVKQLIPLLKKISKFKFLFVLRSIIKRVKGSSR